MLKGGLPQLVHGMEGVDIAVGVTAPLRGPEAGGMEPRATPRARRRLGHGSTVRPRDHPVKAQTVAMPGPDQPIQCVGAVILRNSDELLLVLRANEPSAGLWSIPGGRIEAGETDAEALVREVLEETGLAVTVGALLGTETFGAGTFSSPSHQRYVVNDYRCVVNAGQLTPGDDALDARWVPVDELATYELSPGLLDTLREWGAF